MKRSTVKTLLAFLIMLCSSLTANAEVLKLRSTEYSYKYQYDSGYWSDWSAWESTSVLIVINLSTERVVIYSKVQQEYDIYHYSDKDYHSDGSEVITLSCVDADGIQCGMRIRKQSDGQVQLYVDYADMSFVYNVQFI